MPVDIIKQKLSEYRLFVGFTISIIATAVGATLWLGDKFHGLEQRMAFFEGDSYTLTAASEQALRMAIENPGMKVPDPRNPSKVFEVKIKVED